LMMADILKYGLTQRWHPNIVIQARQERSVRVGSDRCPAQVSARPNMRFTSACAGAPSRVA
jgi:hypothetical protein